MKKREGRLSLRDQIVQNISALELMAGKHLPEIREKYNKPIKKRTASGNPKEGDIQKAILQTLRLDKRVVWVSRFNSGTFKDGDRYIRANTQPGLSDILGMLNGGQLFAIEVKSATGKPSEDQLEFLKIIKNGGGRSGIARSIEEALKIIGE